MKKARLFILLLLAVVILVTVSNPIRRSESNIRDRMLILTPVGTNMEDVIEIIESKDKWYILWIDENYGYRTRWGYPSGNPQNTMIGAKSISAIVGKYKTFLIIDTSVETFWGFDGEGKLIEIDVPKTGDVI